MCSIGFSAKLGYKYKQKYVKAIYKQDLSGNLTKLFNNKTVYKQNLLNIWQVLLIHFRSQFIDHCQQASGYTSNIITTLFLLI